MAESEGIDMPEEITKPETVVTPPATEPSVKTYPEEYVKAVREEAKENRIARKAVEAKLKKLIGLKDDEDLDDAKIVAYQTAQQTQLTAAQQKANEKLLLAEIKSLDGYDVKLVARLLDKSKVTIADDGTVTGLKEAVEALALEFPQVKKMAATGGGANPSSASALPELDQLKADYDSAVKAGNLAQQVYLKNKIFTLEHK